jgi:hypothetical protein
MRYPSNDSAIEELLKGQLDRARAEYDTAHKKFDLLIKDIPSGIPQPDGNLRIRQAGGILPGRPSKLQTRLEAVFRVHDVRNRAERPLAAGLTPGRVIRLLRLQVVR